MGYIQDKTHTRVIPQPMQTPMNCGNDWGVSEQPPHGLRVIAGLAETCEHFPFTTLEVIAPRRPGWPIKPRFLPGRFLPRVLQDPKLSLATYFRKSDFMAKSPRFSIGGLGFRTEIRLLPDFRLLWRVRQGRREIMNRRLVRTARLHRFSATQFLRGQTRTARKSEHGFDSLQIIFVAGAHFSINDPRARFQVK
jgi:hypothetical protein